jgi:ElaB/YqjD/DUF883 family membrane-anchored ribosome-binding protein
METRTDQSTETEFEDSTEKLLQDLNEVIRDGEELLDSGSSQMSDKVRAAREKLQETLQRARETGRKLQERAVATTQATDRLIRQNPYQSIGIAFGVGLLIGVLVDRRIK